MRVHWLLRAGDRDGIGGAFLRTDLATNTSRDLDRGEHHPGTLSPDAGNWALPLICSGDLAYPRGACHIQTAHRTEIHTDTTIDTCLFIDLKPIGHVDLLTRNSSGSSTAFQFTGSLTGYASFPMLVA